MEIKLCRICGKQDDDSNYTHIFRTEGLKNKIETCLPIVVTNECPLPDTICTACLDSVDNFYNFIRNCLQNIIVLEAQYEIIESCLKTKRQVDRSIAVDPCDLLLASAPPPCILPKAEPPSLALEVVSREENLDEEPTALVDYECSSSTDESDIDEDIVRNPLQIPYKSPLRTASPLIFAPSPFLCDAAPKLAATVKLEKPPTEEEKPLQNSGSSDIITEIVQRKYLKRKNVLDGSATPLAKQPRLEMATTATPPSDSSSRRKSSRPKRVEYHLESKGEEERQQPTAPPEKEEALKQQPVPVLPTPGTHTEQTQTCLLCEQPLPNLLELAKHLYQTHAIDFANACGPSFPPATAPQLLPCNKARKIPELVKISDVLPPKRNTSPQKSIADEKQPHPDLLHYNHHQQQQQQQQLFVCSECPLTPTGRQQQQQRSFISFADFSAHRRAQHQIFHCDLCSKFYGRNSHLWKHVNRVHKGHEAITCSECGKTSASEYHLAQHRNKMHSAHQQNTPKSSATSTSSHNKQHRKQSTQKSQIQQSPPHTEQPAADAASFTNHNEDSALSNERGADSDAAVGGADEDEDDLLTQKFQGFDFKSVRQSFLRQELLMNKRQRYVSVLKRNNVLTAEDVDDSNKTTPETNKKLLDITTSSSVSLAPAPKEIDSSSDLYTTIITNYTPPSNEGPYKCPKCFKGFHKKNLLKKHKKNCRPRLQKDLLTRCKTCSRIFKDRQSLAKHLVNYHSEYTCEICAVAVQSKCEIVSHIRFTHPGSELQCHCGQILRSRADLARHKTEHRDSHVCQFCGDALPTKIKLKMHILSLHRKILALSCGICLRLFESQHVLRAHVRHAHANQLRPLTSCTVCGKNYGSKWKTYDHLNKSHGRIFRACKVCLDVFDSERDLQLHMESQHQNNPQNTATLQATAISQAPPPPQQPPPPPPPQQTTAAHNNNQKKVTAVQKKNVLTIAEVYTDEEASDNEEESSNGEDEATASVLKRNGLPQSINRLSLLEKRLMGKKSSPPTQLHYDSDVGSVKKETTSDLSEVGAVAASGSASDDILQNSSKRTVYVNSNDPSLCEICLKVWPAKKHLWQHYIRCHKQTAATVCGICLKTNPSYSALQRHLRDTHPRLLHGCGFGSNFICKICGRYHNASSKLRLHMAIHVGYNGSKGLEVEEEDDDEDHHQREISDQQQTTVSSNNKSNQLTKNKAGRAEEDDEDDDEEEEDDEEDEEEEDEATHHVVLKEERTEPEEQSDDDESNEAANSDEDDDDEEEDEDESMAQSSDSSVAEEEPAMQSAAVTVNVKQEADEGFINYESLIEEVEATDDEEDDSADSDDELAVDQQAQAASQDQENDEDRGTEADDDDDDDEDEEDEEEERAVIKIETEEEVRVAVNTENELEREMLKNMIGESRSVRLSRPRFALQEPPVHLKTEMKEEMADEEMEVVEEDVVSAYEIELLHEEYIKTEAFVSDNWADRDEDEVEDEGGRQQQQQRQPGDELDSAIRSICDEDLIEEEVVDSEGGARVPNDTYRRLIVSGGRVNESELETAVGSIL